MPPKRKEATAEDEIEAPPAKITKGKKEIYQKLLQLYLELSKVVEVKEERQQQSFMDRNLNQLHQRI